MARWDELERRIAQELEDCGYELVDFQCSGGHEGKKVVIKADRASGFTVDDCAAISRDIRIVLDDEEWGVGNYQLEVSSPGLDRPLKKLEDFKRFAGQQVAITTHQAQDGRHNYRGILNGVQDETVCVSVDGEEFAIPHEDIRKAHLVYEQPRRLKLVKS